MKLCLDAKHLLYTVKKYLKNLSFDYYAEIFHSHVLAKNEVGLPARILTIHTREF